MPGLDDLYREIILDHYRSPRNRGELPTPPATMVKGHNPLCGDEIMLYVAVDGDTVSDVKINGQGCSISQSSASMMTQAVIGKPIAQVRELVRQFKSMMSIESGPADAADAADDASGPTGGAPVDLAALGDLAALQGVVKFPVRIKCATLAWNTLLDALDNPDPAAVTTTE